MKSKATWICMAGLLFAGLCLNALASHPCVPETAPDYGIDPEVYWHNHPYNPDGPNFDMDIQSPGSVVNLSPGGSIHSAAGNGDKKIVLSAGGTYGTFSLNDLNNVHIICDNASNRAKIQGSTTIAINPAPDGYEHLRGDKTLDYASYNVALIANGEAEAISIFNERATNFYFKNLIIDGAGGAYSPTHHRARCVLYNNVRWQNFSDVSGDWHHRGTVYAAMGNFNIWFYNCQFYGVEEMISYLDGAVYCGWVNCYMADNHLRGGLLLLVNDDFSRDNDYDGLYKPEEQMAPKYPVIYKCTIDEATGIILDFSNADHALIKSNVFNGGSSGYPLMKNYDRCSQKYPGLMYNGSNIKFVGNRVATPVKNILEIHERKVTTTVGDSLYGANYARIGRYVIRDNVFESSVSQIVESQGDVIGPNYVMNNNNGSTTMPTPLSMQWPTISMTSPANNSHWPTLTDIPISATYNDPDGSIVAVDLLIDDVFIDSDTTAPFNITYPYWKGLTGTHTLKVVAMDDHGNQTMEKRTIIIDSPADEVNVTFSSSSFDVKSATKTPPVSVSKTASVNKSGATAALLVVNPNDIDFPEEFDLKVNGVSVKDDCPLNIAHNGSAAYSSYVPIDLSLLNNGNNTLTWSYINNIDGSTTGYSIDGSLILRVKYGTADEEAPTQPTGLTEVSKTDVSATMRWTASTDNIGVAGYKVYRNGSQVGTSATTNYTDTGLSPSTMYSYKVAAYDNAGNTSSTSTTINITTEAPDTTPPSTPANLAKTDSTYTSISMSWSASTDNLGVAGYKIYRNGGQVDTSASTTYTDTGLTEGTSYDYRVAAYDAAGNTSPTCSVVSMSTDTDTTAPGINEVTAIDATTVDVVFSEDVNETSAETTGNYAIDNGISVSAAVLQGDGNTVRLTVSTLTESTTYTITINNVTDTATTPNTIASNSQDTFEYLGLGFLAHWKFDEGSGSTAADSVGSNDGTISGATWTSGQINGALDFSEDHVDLGGLDVTGSALTITAWIYPDTLTDWGRIVSKASGTADVDHYWMISMTSSTTGNRPRFRLKTGGTTTTLIADSGGITAGSWQHIAVTYDGSNMRIYKNGTQVGSTAKTGDLTTSGSVDAWIGDNPVGGGGANAFDGKIDDVRIYSKALNASEIAEVMNYTGTEQVATPTIAPNGGTHSVSTTVTLSCATSGADIRYTTNGSDPTSGSTLYSSPIVIDSSLTLKARAFKTGMTDSAIASASFTITAPDYEAPTVPTGLHVSGTNSTSLDLAWTASTDNIGVAGYRVYRDGSFIATSAGTTYSAGGLSTDTEYSFRVSAYDAAGNTSAWSSAATATTLNAAPASAPTMAPPGTYFANNVKVYLSTKEAGGTIRYTTDGSTPTESDTAYTGPITLTGSATLKARTFASGKSPSATTEGTFTEQTHPNIPARIIMLVFDTMHPQMFTRIPTPNLNECINRGTIFTNTHLILPDDTGPDANYPWNPSFPNPQLMSGTVLMGIDNLWDHLIAHQFSEYDAFTMNCNAYIDLSGNSYGHGVHRGFTYVHDLQTEYGGGVGPMTHDEYSTADAQAIITANNPKFMRVHLQASNYGSYLDSQAGRNVFSASSEYYKAVTNSDRIVGDFIDWLDSNGYMDDTVVILMGDNAPNNTGGHAPFGDGEAHIVPVIMFGKGIKTNSFEYAEFNDIAATIAYLGGKDNTTYGQGRVLTEAFVGYADTQPADRWQKRLNEVLDAHNTLTTTSPGSGMLATNAAFQALDDDFMKLREVCSWDNTMNSLPAVTEYNEDIYAQMVSLLNGDDEDPTVPTNLRVTETNGTSVVLAWDASTDNTAVTGYRIYRGGSPIGTTAATTYTAGGLTPLTAYAFTVAAYDAAANESSQSAPVNVTTVDAGSGELPSPWQQADVGSIPAGSATYYAPEFTAVGAGKIDSTATADSFHFIYQPLSGDIDISAHVTAIHASDAAARAGVMIRESLYAGSMSAFMATENVASRNSAWRRRTATDANNTSTSGSVGDQDRWVRLVRTGNTFTAYEKENEGDAWTQVGSSSTIAMSNTVLVGMAFMANSLTTVATGVYESVSVSGTSATVATPGISPNGGTFSGTATVTLSCATSGAEIRYTTDGNDPTTGSSLYSSPIVVSASLTLKAKGFKDGMTASAIASASFTIDAGGGSSTGSWFEAENGAIGGAWTVKSDDVNASGGEYVSTVGNVGAQYAAGEAGAGTCAIDFTTAAADTYAIWARVKTPSGADDSFFVKVDGEAYALWDCDESSTEWTWQKWAEKSLSAASHTLTIAEREDGASIDKVLITDDLGYTPTGQGGSTGEPGDTDGDGLPDEWEITNYGSTEVVNGNSDTDGDGLTALQEYIAGTAPTSSVSVLAIEQVIGGVSGEKVIQWKSVTDRQYSLYWSTNLGGGFQLLNSGINGGTDSMIYTDEVHEAAGTIYYRVKAVRP